MKMNKSTKRSRRHRNAQQTEGKEQQPFFSKNKATPVQKKEDSAFFQPKLTIGEPNDKYEQEADSVADAVVNQSGDTPAVQSKEITSIQRYMTNAKEDEMGTNTERIEKDKAIQEKPEVQKMEEEEPVQMMEDEEPLQAKEEEESVQKMEEEEPVQMMEEEEPLQAKEEEEPVQMQEEEEALQAKSNGANNTASPQVAKQLNASKGNGSNLPAQTNQEMSQAFGYDFSGVKVHTNGEAERMNQELGAQAFTHGSDVYFNAGKYSPGSKEGKRLLAHELTHVVQQRGEVMPKIQQKNENVKIVTTNISISNSLKDIFTKGTNFIFSAKTKEELQKISFGTKVDKSLQDGLKNYLGILINGKMITPNQSISLVLDFSNTANQPDLTNFPLSIQAKLKSKIVYEFTYEKLTNTNKITINELGTFSPRKSKHPGLNNEQKRLKFETYGFKFENGWTLAHKDAIINTVLDISSTTLNSIRGLTFKRSTSHPTSADTAGEYRSGNHSITFYDLAFSKSNTVFGNSAEGFSSSLEQTVFHEVGHAVDLNPLRNTFTTYSDGPKLLEQEFAKYYNSHTRQFSFPSQEIADNFSNRKKILVSDTKKQMTDAQSESGYKWKLVENIYNIKNAGIDTAFRKAVVADGSVKITNYADTNWKETFAESFSFYYSDTTRFKNLRPKTYQYFKTKYPK